MEDNMKIKQLVVLLLCFTFGFMTLNAGQNHFKVYKAKPAEPFEPIGVVLMDQFHKEPFKVKLYGIEFFANPVLKRHGDKKFPIPVPNAHLTWYRFKEPRPVKRVVKFKNQFGLQQWILGEASHLLVPTQKLMGKSSMPRKFNHFIAYKYLDGDFKPFYLELKDQFDGKPVKVKVVKPMFFCNPVSKNKEPIYNKEYHLACYIIEGGTSSHPRSLGILNQFKKNRLYMGPAVMLCVPTGKLGFKVLR